MNTASEANGASAGQIGAEVTSRFAECGIMVEQTRQGGGLAVESSEVWRFSSPLGIVRCLPRRVALQSAEDLSP